MDYCHSSILVAVISLLGCSSPSNPETGYLHPSEIGSNGSQVATGSADAGVAPNNITKVWQCNFSVGRLGENSQPYAGPTNCTDTVVQVNGWYYAAEMGTGDLFVRVGIDVYNHASLGSGYSSTFFWRAGSDEAVHGLNWLMLDICRGSLVSDANTIGNWTFKLNRDLNSMTAEYLDSDIRNGKVDYTIGCIN